MECVDREEPVMPLEIYDETDQEDKIHSGFDKTSDGRACNPRRANYDRDSWAAVRWVATLLKHPPFELGDLSAKPLRQWRIRGNDVDRTRRSTAWASDLRRGNCASGSCPMGYCNGRGVDSHWAEVYVVTRWPTARNKDHRRYVGLSGPTLVQWIFVRYIARLVVKGFRRDR